MHAVVGQVKIDAMREDDARKLLDDFVVPAAKALPGFQGGYWSRAVDGDTGHSLMLFDSEENARSAAEQVAQGPPPGAPVSFAKRECLRGSRAGLMASTESPADRRRRRRVAAR